MRAMRPHAIYADRCATIKNEESDHNIDSLDYYPGSGSLYSIFWELESDWNNERKWTNQKYRKSHFRNRWGFKKDELEKAYPKFTKLNESSFELVYIIGFDPPYIMWNSKERIWKEGFPSTPEDWEKIK